MLQKFLAIVLVGALAAPLFSSAAVAAEGGDAAPVPDFTFGEIVVGQPARLNASVVDEDPAGVTFEWDVAPDEAGFVAEATGASLKLKFAEPGVVKVALRATDAAGNQGIVTKSVPVDDFFAINITFVYPPNRDDHIFAHLRVSDWAGAGVGGQKVSIQVLYQPQREGQAVVLREFVATTEENGEKYFPIARDTNFGNIPGRHLLYAHTVVEDTVLGDEERVELRKAYVIPLPF